jgi:hypothetical protein
VLAQDANENQEQDNTLFSSKNYKFGRKMDCTYDRIMP